MIASDILTILSENMIQIQKFGVEKIGLFGSHSRSEGNNQSDVDLLVYFKPGLKSFDNYMDLKFFLEDLLHIKVDLVTAESISSEFSDLIQRDLLYA